MDAIMSAEPRVALTPQEPLSPAAVSATSTLGEDATSSLAKLVQKANLVVAEVLSFTTLTMATTQENTTPDVADTVMTMAQGNEAIQNTDARMTSPPLDPVGLRRSDRIARNIQAKSTHMPLPEGTDTTKKRTRAFKEERKAIDICNTESQVSGEDEPTPRKRLRWATGKNMVSVDDSKDSDRMGGQDSAQMDGQDGADLSGEPKMDRKNGGPDLSGRDITNDGADGSITKAEPVSTPTPKRRGRLPRKSNTSTSTFAPSAPPTKVRPRTTTGKRATKKEKAVADPTSLENLDSRAGTVDVGNQDTMHDGSLLMGSTTTSIHAEGDINIQGSSSDASAIAPGIFAPPKINPQEPLSSLPVEILQHIISWLPLQEIARASMVSKSWLGAVHNMSVWKIICQEAGLGEPKKKYKTHMALACADSYWICTRCYSYSNAKTHRANLPLPVADVDENNHVHMLCLECRREYYRKHPQSLKKGVYRQEFAWVPRAGSIAPNGIYINYGLTGNQLDGLETIGSSSQGLPLYDRSQVQKRALHVHGGWVGVDAEATNPRRKRASACAARAKAAKICTKRPSTTPKMLERSRIAAEKRAIREEEQERRREEREAELRERRRERAQWRRLLRWGHGHYYY